MESVKQMNHFLSYKTQIKFKWIEDRNEHFSLQRKIGEGAFAIVYSGRTKPAEIQCAVKVISKRKLNNQEYIRMNQNEFEIVEQISHPNIVRVYELLEDQDFFYIVMELMQGGSLINRIRSTPDGHLSEF